MVTDTNSFRAMLSTQPELHPFLSQKDRVGAGTVKHLPCTHIFSFLLTCCSHKSRGGPQEQSSVVKPLPRLPQRPYCRKREGGRKKKSFFLQRIQPNDVVFLLSLLSFSSVNLQVLSERNYHKEDITEEKLTCLRTYGMGTEH